LSPLKNTYSCHISSYMRLFNKIIFELWHTTISYGFTPSQETQDQQKEHVTL